MGENSLHMFEFADESVLRGVKHKMWIYMRTIVVRFLDRRQPSEKRYSGNILSVNGTLAEDCSSV